jgi:hypothetical protein
LLTYLAIQQVLQENMLENQISLVARTSRSPIAPLGFVVDACKLVHGTNFGGHDIESIFSLLEIVVKQEQARKGSNNQMLHRVHSQKKLTPVANKEFEDTAQQNHHKSW